MTWGRRRLCGAPIDLRWPRRRDAACARRAWAFMGHRVEGMTETTGHELAMKKVLGPRIVGHRHRPIPGARGAIPALVALERWAEVKAQVGAVRVPEEAGRESMQVYLALQETDPRAGSRRRSHRLLPAPDGQGLPGRIAPCGERASPVGCEGDINGALGMLLLTLLTGEPVHNTDMLDPIPDAQQPRPIALWVGRFSLACGPRAYHAGAGAPDEPGAVLPISRHGPVPVR